MCWQVYCTMLFIISFCLTLRKICNFLPPFLNKIKFSNSFHSKEQKIFYFFKLLIITRICSGISLKRFIAELLRSANWKKWVFLSSQFLKIIGKVLSRLRWLETSKSLSVLSRLYILYTKFHSNLKSSMSVSEKAYLLILCFNILEVTGNFLFTGHCLERLMPWTKFRHNEL